MNDNNPDTFALACPVPTASGDTVRIADGGGGRSQERLLDTIFRPAFSNPILDRHHDGARLDLSGPLAFTTDTYVVNPLFFPGGDIGTLAINGTVNDLAMCGARPKHLSAGFILEEGLPLETLRRVVTSMASAAAEAGVTIVTGDLKVVDRGKADGLFVNTAGIGEIVVEGRDRARERPARRRGDRLRRYRAPRRRGPVDARGADVRNPRSRATARPSPPRCLR